MWLPLLLLCLLHACSSLGLELSNSQSASFAKQRPLSTWFVEHPQFAVALPGESVFFGCRTNSAEGDEAIRWLRDGKPIPKGDPEFK